MTFHSSGGQVESLRRTASPFEVQVRAFSVPRLMWITHNANRGS